MTSVIDHRQAIVADVVCDIPPGRPFDLSVVLRAFDGLRRDLAMQVDGQAGIGLGFDTLDISWARVREVSSGSQLALSATLLSRARSTHEVEYVAQLLPVDGQAQQSHIVRARGWTLSPKNNPVAPTGSPKDC